MLLKDVKNIPNEILKKKNIDFYKAFIIHDPDDTMRVNSNIDILGITEEAAVASLVNTLPLEDALDIKGKCISFAIFRIKKEELMEKDLVDAGDIKFENGLISVTLRDKIYTIDVEDKIIENIDIDINPKTEYRLCTNIKLVKV